MHPRTMALLFGFSWNAQNAFQVTRRCPQQNNGMDLNQKRMHVHSGHFPSRLGCQQTQCDSLFEQWTEIDNRTIWICTTAVEPWWNRIKYARFHKKQHSRWPLHPRFRPGRTCCGRLLTGQSLQWKRSGFQVSFPFWATWSPVTSSAPASWWPSPALPVLPPRFRPAEPRSGIKTEVENHWSISVSLRPRHFRNDKLWLGKVTLEKYAQNTKPLRGFQRTGDPRSRCSLVLSKSLGRQYFWNIFSWRILQHKLALFWHQTQDAKLHCLPPLQCFVSGFKELTTECLLVFCRSRSQRTMQNCPEIHTNRVFRTVAVSQVACQGDGPHNVVYSLLGTDVRKIWKRHLASDQQGSAINRSVDITETGNSKDIFILIRKPGGTT